MPRFSPHLAAIIWLLHLLCAAQVLAQGDENTDTLEPIAGPTPSETEPPEPSATPLSTPGPEPTRGAVASENRDCSELGAKVIEDGGNAADAMITTVLCTGVKSPGHSGIGGGGFMLVRHPRNKNGSYAYEYIDFRETAPAYAHKNMYKEWDKMNSTTGGAASGIPGELRGLEYLYETYGSRTDNKTHKMAWGDLVRRASKVAREGFTINADFVRLLSYAGPTWSTGNFFQNDHLWSVDFIIDDRLIRQGDHMTRRRLADTLDIIAEKGVGEFYNGSIARQIQKIVQQKGGNITLEDLRNYRIKKREASQIEFGDYKLFSCGAPAGGSVALSILKTIDGYSDFNLTSDNSTLAGLSTHRLTEAYRFAYSQRMKMGDPDYEPEVYKLQTRMLEDSYADNIRSRIWDNTTLPPGSYGVPHKHETQTTFEGPVTPGTSYIAAADASGLAISLTTTINGFWGSHVMTPGGFIMNNQMDDFSVPNRNNMFGYPPSEENYIKAGKRPLSSISPTIVERNNKLYLVTGSAGGSRIITTAVQNLIHILRQEMSLKTALGTPRIHDQLYPDHAEMEWSFSNETSLYLALREHAILRLPRNLGTAQAVRLWPNGTFDAAGEPRQLGSGGVAV